MKTVRLWVIRRWRQLHRGRPRVHPILIRSRDDLPERLDPRVVYVVQTSTPKWLILDCPCGTGHEIAVSLQAAHSPHWRLRRDHPRSRLSVSPSIDAASRDRRCHFWLVDGRVAWCDDTDGRP